MRGLHGRRGRDGEGGGGVNPGETEAQRPLTAPPTPSVSPRTAASNAVPCYRQHSGTQPGLSRSPGGSPSSRDPPQDSPAWGGEAPAGAAVWGGGGLFPCGSAIAGGGGTLPAWGGRNSMGGTVPGCQRAQAAPIPPPPPPPSSPPPSMGTHFAVCKRTRAIDLFGHPDSAQRCGGVWGCWHLTPCPMCVPPPPFLLADPPK